MRYKELINLNKSFQYSINLQYDIDNIDKVKGYIPTKQSIRILKEYLKNIVLDTTDKTTVLIGPYGKGKSHLALVILSILSSDNKTIINDLVKKIKDIDEETAALIKDLLKKKTKFLPLIINSNNQDLQQALLISINKAIEKYELKDITLKTYFSNVIEFIEKWKNEYPGTLKLFEDELKKYKLNVEEYILKLKEFSTDAYKIFLNIFPLISSGMEYNPLVNTDVVEILNEFNHKICEEYGYSGTFILFDEFSKFIESSVDRNNAKDMKVLQDIAELCNRTKGNQIHLACITHKSINEYIRKIPANKIDAWRAIEGRFKEIYFTTSSKQNYELIGNTIISDKDKIKELIEKDAILTEIYENCYEIYKTTYNFKSYKKNIEINTFPLNPISTYALPIISEKVAQNERTLFTFLSKRGKNTLQEFLSKAEIGDLLEVNKLYDYFEDLFKKEIFNEKIREIWMKCDVALKKTDIEDEKIILKGLAIIKIVDSEDLLPSNNITLKNAFQNIDVDYTIDQLIEKGILIRRRLNYNLDFMPGIKININEKINDVIKTKFRNIDLAKELENIYRLGYVTAKKYNDEFSMTRYFRHRFITIEEFMTYKDVQELIKFENSDGIIINVIEKDYKKLDDFFNNKDKFECYSNLIINIPKKAFDFEQEILELLSIRHLKGDNDLLDENELLIEYLDILEEDLLEIIKNKVENMFDIEIGNSNLIWRGEFLDIKTPRELNRKVSEICSEIYCNTPKINNELINKRKISSIILKARNKIVDGIFSGNLEFEGHGPEVTIIRALLTNKGLGTKNEIDRDIDLVIQALIVEVMNIRNKKIPFKSIYDILEGTAHGFGMRRGVIPIYIAMVLSQFKEDIILYTGERNKKEVPLNYNTLNNINENPELYYLEIDEGSREKDEYFRGLERVFLVDRHKNMNKYERLMETMQDWIKALDKFTRVHEHIFNSEKIINSDVIKLRKELLKYDVNVREFIFNSIPRICNIEDLQKTLGRIVEIKDYLDSRSRNVKLELIDLTKDMFVEGYKGSLGQALNIWINDMEQYKKDYLYDVVTNKLIDYAKKLKNNNEEIIIDRISIIITGLTIADWNDETIEVFLDTLSNCLEKIRDLKDNIDENSEAITLVSNIEGNKVEKVFEKTEISVLGSTLVNEVEEAFEEYGESITDDEKRTILIELLEKFI